jgi:membrane fusion protein (multidrug efflux system)
MPGALPHSTRSLRSVRPVAPTLLVASVIASAFFAGTGCKREEAAASQPPKEAAPLVRVQTSPVAERPMPEFLILTGSLRADQESNIAADANGKVLQMLVERGQTVTRGQVIATLDARAASLGATAAEAQSKLAQSQLEQAQKECGRVKHLLETGAISQADFDRQTAQCTAQQWSAAAAEAQQQSATKLLGDTRIRAPFDGIIGERMVNVGQYVQPSTQVASVYDPDPLRLQVTVPEANLADVKQGTPVTFSVAAFGDQHFSATVKYISPNVRESTRDLVVEAMAANPDGRLRPGMFAIARLELTERPHLVVPVAAVQRDESEARLYVVGPSKEVQERLVQLGETRGDVVAILGGVKVGETVVLSPGPDVRDGAHVE